MASCRDFETKVLKAGVSKPQKDGIHRPEFSIKVQPLESGSIFCCGFESGRRRLLPGSVTDPRGTRKVTQGAEGEADCQLKRELECRIPRLHSPANSRRFREIFGDFCKNKTSFLLVFVENRFLTFAPVDLRGKPEPVPRTQVLSHNSQRCQRATGRNPGARGSWRRLLLSADQGYGQNKRGQWAE